ncbi:MAG: DNA polymerase/3'-5' exonuclease PolX [Saprospiraceae bacterium]|nr:DNA polymerase/3'-5' exonuclease PolX [Saprospiraceae bacterium]
MTNKEIAKQFDLLASIMELLEENAFKIRTYQNAYLGLRKWDIPLKNMSIEEMSAIPGVGKSSAEKIQEALQNGEIQALSAIKEKVPSGVVEMLKINGLGPKKVRQIWKELGIESVVELLYACNENRLIEVKGFGLKTQQELTQKINFYLQSQGQFLYANLDKLESTVFLAFENPFWTRVGLFGRQLPVLNQMEYLTSEIPVVKRDQSEITLVKVDGNRWSFECQGIPIITYVVDGDDFEKVKWEMSASEEFLSFTQKDLTNIDWADIMYDKSIFEILKKPYLPVECRESYILDHWDGFNSLDLITPGDIKGIVHNHSTWSDGIHTLEEMAMECRRLDYSYFVISDHSKSAGYANGLSVERLFQQWEEIDFLNKKMEPFKTYKGIESDILVDGRLDYEDEILKQFDLVVASVHSVLNMDEEKATQRLITAIENPYTRILGHPTGRLLLSRKGYPLDMLKIIDACAANNVVIELNANPYRLDLDWTWIAPAMKKGVMISINPDAHSRGGIQDVNYGVIAARKGGLTKEFCLNAKSQSEWETWLRSK